MFVKAMAGGRVVCAPETDKLAAVQQVWLAIGLATRQQTIGQQSVE